MLVFSGGDAPHPGVVARLPRDARAVVAADSGLDHARALGFAVDVVVGDLDSVSPDGLAAAGAAGTRVERHPAAKDHTDLELALRQAVALGATEVVVVAGDGGRLDHTLVAAAVLAAPDLAGVAVTAWMGPARLDVVHPARPLALEGPAGALLTLLAVGGPARAVTTTGLRYALHREDLDPTSGRGLSNELAGGPASVALEAGVLLAVQPQALG